jgi:hypothetical protein
MFLDERGTGLRVTWHPERDLVVLSVWQGDSCVGTFRMSVQDIPRLSGLLAAALGDWVDQTGGAPNFGGPGSGGPGSGGPGGSGAGGPGVRGAGAGGPRSDLGSRITGERITGEWDLGDPGILGGGATAKGSARAEGSATAEGGAVAGLSVQQRIRLSRPVLKLRGIQHRRRSE